MNKLNYDSPTLEIRWFESEDVMNDDVYSDPLTGDNSGDIVAPDEW